MPGTLTLRPLSAKLTRNTELFGTMDPYCKVVMGKQKVQSEVCENGGKNPHWESSFLVLKRTTEPVCEVEIKEKDWLLPDGTIGVCKVNINEVETQKRVLKWYPVLFKDKPAGQILIEASYESDNATSKNIPVPEHQTVPQQIVQPILNQPQIPQPPISQAAPVQHDFRQPVHNQEGMFQGGYIHGYNPLNQAQPISQPAYNQPINTHDAQMYAPPATEIHQDSNYPQKYPQFESQSYPHQYENQNYGYQPNTGAQTQELHNGHPYNYESRPVTDFPYTGTHEVQDKKGINGIDIIRGTR